MADFAARLDEINALAEATPGLRLAAPGRQQQRDRAALHRRPDVHRQPHGLALDRRAVGVHLRDPPQPAVQAPVRVVRAERDADHDDVVAARGDDPRHPRRARGACATSPTTARRPRRSRSSSASRRRTRPGEPDAARARRRRPRPRTPSGAGGAAGTTRGSPAPPARAAPGAGRPPCARRSRAATPRGPRGAAPGPR